MARLLVLAVVIAAALAVAPSCGGGSSARDTSNDVTFDAPFPLPVGDWDGITHTRPLPDQPVVVRSHTTGIACGDWWWNGDWPITPDQEARGFFTFDIGALPASPAVVRAATLTIYVWGKSGAPLPGGAQVDIEHVDLGGAFTGADHAVPGSFIQTVTSSDGITGYTIDVRSEIGADQIAMRPRSSFRIRMTTWGSLNNGNDDTLHFNDAEDVAGSPPTAPTKPKLTITYTPAP